MCDCTILTIAHDQKFLALFRQHFHDQFCGARVVVSSTTAEACTLLESARPRLVVVHWPRDRGRMEELDRLLWATTVQARRVPIVVIADRYRTDQATTMYRMGITDYMSRTHHLNQLGLVISAYLPRQLLAPQGAEAAEATGSLGKPWASSRKAGSRANRAV
jgi:DNA-binding NtrC family response regulator